MVRITCFFFIIVPVLIGGFSINNPNLMFDIAKQPDRRSFHASLYGRMFADDFPEANNDAEDEEDDVDQDNEFIGDMDSNFDNVNGVLCRKCEPGFGLVSMCNSTHPTVCEPCTSGVNYSHTTYHFRPCTPCSHCGANMYVETVCTVEKDTFCDWCRSWNDGSHSDEDIVLFHNEDFWRKCQGTGKEKPVVRANDLSSSDDLKQTSKDDSKSLDKPRLLSAEEINKLNHEIEQELNIDGELDREILTGVTFVDVPPPKFNDVNDPHWQLTDDEEQVSFSPLHNPITKDIYEDGRLQRPNVASLTLKTDEEDIVFKPSVHEYPYNDLVHASAESTYGQLKMIAIAYRYWFAATAGLLTFILVVLIALKCRKRRDVKFMIATLTDDDNKIIEECAQRMESCEKVIQAKRNRLRRINPVNVDAENDHDVDYDDREEDNATYTTPVHVTENPLIQYLEQDGSKKEAPKNTSEPVNV